MNIESKITPTGFVQSVADKLAEIATAARESNPKHNGELRATSSLDIVERYVRGEAEKASTLDTSARLAYPESRPVRDPHFYALYDACGDATRYQPGRLQLDLLRDLAADFGGYLDPREMLAELACRANRDARAEVAAERDRLERERAELLERAERGEALRGPLEQAQARISEQHAENATLRAERDEANRQLARERVRIAVLWGQVNGDHPDESDAKPDVKPRRVKVEGEVGIYVTDAGSFQIGFKDSDGRQRWQTVEGDLEEARAVRAQRVAEAKAALAA
jgi:hypothetical protein